MKASELIKELQELINKHGDLPVCAYDGNPLPEYVSPEILSLTAYPEGFYSV